MRTIYVTIIGFLCTLNTMVQGGALLNQSASGSQPIVKSTKRRIDPDSETMNVLIFGLFTGSHYKNAKELMKWLPTERFPDGRAKYNVTALLWKNNNDF